MLDRFLNGDHRRIGRYLIAAVAVILILLLLLYWIPRLEMRGGGEDDLLYDDGEDERIYVDGVCYQAKNLDTCLVIGLDKFRDDAKETAFNNQQQADFLMLLGLDKTTKTGFALHLNRDTMTEITMLGIDGEEAGSYTAQLALSHTYGSGQQDSCRNTVKAVSHLLYDVPIDHYVSVTMDAVRSVNDAAGGVTVLIEDDFSTVDDTLVKGKKICLKGDQALHFVRARKGMEDASNMRRMERQRTYLKALRQKTLDTMKENSTFAFSALTDISPYMITDCSVYELADIVDAVTQYEFFEISSLAGNSVKGENYMEYYVDETELQRSVLQWFYDPVDPDGGSSAIS